MAIDNETNPDRAALLAELEALRSAVSQLQVEIVIHQSQLYEQAQNELIEQQYAQQSLQASEERFRSLSTSAPISICQTNADGICQYINPSWQTMTGVALECCIGRPWMQIIHPDDRAAVQAVWDAQRRGEEAALPQEFRLGQDESMRWISWQAAPLYAALGEVVGYVITAADITQRKQAEILLHQREQEFRALVDHAPDTIARFDRQLRHLYVNPVVEQVTGIPASSFLGKTNQELGMPQPQVEQWGARLNHVFTTGEQQTFEFEFPTPHGPRHYQSRCVPELALDGSVASILVITRDITEPKQAEIVLRQSKAELEARVAERTADLHQANQRLRQELAQRQRAENALRQSEALFRSLSESAPIGITRMDAHGNLVYLNAQAQTIMGCTEAEALGKGWIQFVHPDDLSQLRSQWEAGGVIQAELPLEVRYCHRDGTIRFGRVNVAPIPSADQQGLGYVSTIEDITAVQEIERIKREFTSIVSHELRTPLASIRGALGLLASGLLDDDQSAIQQMLEVADSEADRLVRLVNDILDFNRMDNQQVALHQQWMDVVALVYQAIEGLRPLAEEQGIELVFALENSDTSMQAFADPDQIVQTLVNLLSNAIKFSPAQATVTVTVVRQPNRFLFTVADHGRGIPAEKLDTIFAPFQQVDSSDSRQKGGTGLGLAICRQIVHQHGGNIWVESSVGKGSRFYFTLPLPQIETSR